MGSQEAKKPGVKDHDRNRHPSITQALSRAAEAIPEQGRLCSRLDIRFDAAGNGTARVFLSGQEEHEVSSVP